MYSNTWVFLIQILRMYHHTLPIIYRISYIDNSCDLTSSSLQAASYAILLLFPVAPPVSLDHDMNNPILYTSSTHQLNTTMQISTKIIISNTMNPHCKKQNNEYMIILDSQTIFKDDIIKYYGWTSISTLYDLI